MAKGVVLAFLTVISMTWLATASAVEQNADERTISEYCSTHSDLGLTHGGCVAYFVTHNIVPHDSSICRDESIQSLLGMTNHGQCVKKLGDMRK